MRLIIIVLVIISSVSSLDEGSRCNNFDGTLGVCVVDRNCKWALDKLKSKEIKINQLIRCGLKGSSSVICCKDESVTVAPISKSTNKLVSDFVFSDGEPPVATTTATKTTVPPVTKRKSEMMCDLIKNWSDPSLDFHIINGEAADVGEFPHMAAIGYTGDDFDENVLDYACGGSLISKVSLILSEYDESPSLDIAIKKVHIHPGYSSRRKYNDIALLELANAVEVRKTVKPACLYSSSASFNKDKDLFISGWGRVDASTSEKFTWLQKAEINEVPLDECRRVYSEINLTQLPENLKISQLCASKVKDGKIVDACQGDSGGPLQQKIKIGHEIVYYIVGVTSFGASCGSEIPGVYTRVSEYLDWIESVAWAENKVEL